MAKKVIQMYDKYKSTTKIYPKVIKDCLQDDITEYIEGQVVANPELAGTEAELGSIQVGDTKYKVGGGNITKYIHTITVAYNDASGYRFTISFESSSNVACTTWSDVTKLLNAENRTRVLASGFERDSNNSKNRVVGYVFADGTTWKGYGYDITSGYSGNDNSFIIYTTSVINDAVN